MEPPETNGFDFDVAISFPGKERGAAEKIPQVIDPQFRGSQITPGWVGMTIRSPRHLGQLT